MRLHYSIPSKPFRSLLTVHAEVSDVEQRITEILPAMLPNLHIWLEGEGQYAFESDEPKIAPRVSLIGPTSRAYRIVLPPGTLMLSAGFLPSGWMSLIHPPAMEFADGVIDGETLWGRKDVDRLCDALLSQPLGDSRYRILEAFLASQLDSREVCPRSPSSAIDHWLEHSSTLCLDELHGLLDVSTRHMRRLCLDLHGASPKTLAMKYRALRAATSMAIHGDEGLDEALALFADQAHLTRDFRRFVGWTPLTFARERQNVTAATITGRRKAGAVRPLALWS